MFKGRRWQVQLTELTLALTDSPTCCGMVAARDESADTRPELLQQARWCERRRSRRDGVLELISCVWHSGSDLLPSQRGSLTTRAALICKMSLRWCLRDCWWVKIWERPGCLWHAHLHQGVIIEFFWYARKVPKWITLFSFHCLCYDAHFPDSDVGLDLTGLWWKELRTERWSASFWTAVASPFWNWLI